MSVKDILLKRNNVFKFSEKVPDESLIQEMLNNAFYSPSFGNLMPWKIYVLGPNEKSNQIKKDIYEKVMIPHWRELNYFHNFQSLAPYVLLYCKRFIDVEDVKGLKAWFMKYYRGYYHYHEKKRLNEFYQGSIEMGIHSAYINLMAIERGMECGYAKCFSPEKFRNAISLVKADEEPEFIMSIGYKDSPFMMNAFAPDYVKFQRPPKEKIYDWVE